MEITIDRTQISTMRKDLLAIKRGLFSSTQKLPNQNTNKSTTPPSPNQNNSSDSLPNLQKPIIQKPVAPPPISSPSNIKATFSAFPELAKRLPIAITPLSMENSMPMIIEKPIIKEAPSSQQSPVIENISTPEKEKAPDNIKVEPLLKKTFMEEIEELTSLKS